MIRKYKPKIQKYKEKTKELTDSNDSLIAEINKLKKELEESKCELRLLETNWSKRYNELQTNSQQAMVIKNIFENVSS